MKKFLITIILGYIAICGFAQEHLSFKGIPIEGSMTSFCQKLKAKGFTQIDCDHNSTLFTGDFTGRQATISVGASDDGKSVYSVVVFFDPSKEWKTLVSTYSYYKDLYTRKYGEPAASRENIPESSDPNWQLMYDLEQGTITYTSNWIVSGGEIDLSITKSSGHHEGMVMICYRDSQNVNAKIQKDLEDI